MRYVVVSVFDRAVGAYARPFFVRSEGEGVRSFIDEVNRKAADNPLSQHPGDYVLMMLGHFDDNDGKFVCPANGPLELLKGQVAEGPRAV